MSTDLPERILAVINEGRGDFEALALELFAFQYERNPIYRAYCDRQPKVTHWREIPAVPTSAFKDFAMACFPAEEAVAVFHTSGTTRENTGRHYFKTLELYDAAIRPNFAAHLLPEKLPALVLTPSPQDAPHSSLAYMMGVVAGDDAEYFVEGDTLSVERLKQRLCEMQWANQPILLLGTAFAFVHFFDQNLQFELPAGSRAMETGGFKGRSREVTKAELYRIFQVSLGIPPDRVVSE